MTQSEIQDGWPALTRELLEVADKHGLRLSSKSLRTKFEPNEWAEMTLRELLNLFDASDDSNRAGVYEAARQFFLDLHPKTVSVGAT